MLKSFQNIEENTRENDGNEEQCEDDDDMDENLYRCCLDAIKTCHFNNNEHRDSQEFTEITFFKIPSIITTVYAAPPPKDDTPKKPPKLKASDLDLYKSPHYDYKEYTHNCKYVCPGYNEEKILRDSIVDDVSEKRKVVQKVYSDVKSEVVKSADQVKGKIIKTKDDIVSYMRCPKNMVLRQAVVVTSGAVGFYLGRRCSRYRDSLIRGFFWGGVGLSFSGALCFPSETDVALRNFGGLASDIVINTYRIYNNSFSGVAGKLPCPKDIPAFIEKKDKDKPICEKKK